jgi:hypothetical protein
MPVTSVEQEYVRLRSYLNPIIQGPNVDAVLTALASGSSSYLVNNVNAVNENLYVVTAVGTYLDARLAEYGITRPPAIGLSDQIFSQIGIQVRNRKQVRDLMNKIMDLIFGDQFTKASDSSTTYEPYDLADGDTLIVNFDEANTTTIVFHAAQFQNIAAATAQEVADAITEFLSNLGLSGTAISNNNGNGNYVQLLSDTIGPASSVTVMGGSAQNVLLFPSPVVAGGNMSTQWTLSQQNGGVIRFTWTGGANPQLGKVLPQDYVNIYGGGFSSSQEGTYTIINSVGGAVDSSYFDIENIFGTTGIVTQGADDAVLFYNPTRKMLASSPLYAALYQVQANTLQIFLPASTQVVRRSRIGSAHLHYPPSGTFTLFTNPSPGDTFSITTINTLIAGTDFVIGATPDVTTLNLATVIETNIPGLVTNVNFTTSVQGTILDDGILNTVLIQSDNAALTLTIAYTGSQDVVASGPMGDVTSLAPNQPGPYMYDTTQPFVLSNVNTTLTQELDATKSKVFTVVSSNGFPNTQGYILFGYGTESQEGPVPYIGSPSGDTLLISPAYTIQNVHPVGTSVFLVEQNAPVTVSSDGLNYPFYITDIVSGRIYAQDLIESVAAAGVNLVFTILYPSDVGLGRAGTIYSEIVEIWGE